MEDTDSDKTEPYDLDEDDENFPLKTSCTLAAVPSSSLNQTILEESQSLCDVSERRMVEKVQNQLVVDNGVGGLSGELRCSNQNLKNAELTHNDDDEMTETQLLDSDVAQYYGSVQNSSNHVIGTRKNTSVFNTKIIRCGRTANSLAVTLEAIKGLNGTFVENKRFDTVRQDNAYIYTQKTQDMAPLSMGLPSTEVFQAEISARDSVSAILNQSEPDVGHFGLTQVSKSNIEKNKMPLNCSEIKTSGTKTLKSPVQKIFTPRPRALMAACQNTANFFTQTTQDMSPLSMELPSTEVFNNAIPLRGRGSVGQEPLSLQVTSTQQLHVAVANSRISQSVVNDPDPASRLDYSQRRGTQELDEADSQSLGLPIANESLPRESQQLGFTQATTNMEPLSMQLVETQKFQAELEARLDVNSESSVKSIDEPGGSPDTPAIDESDFSSLGRPMQAGIGTKWDWGAQQQCGFTQQTQDMSPLSLNLVSTQDFVADMNKHPEENSSRKFKASVEESQREVIVPSFLRDSVFSRFSQKAARSNTHCVPMLAPLDCKIDSRNAPLLGSSEKSSCSSNSPLKATDAFSEETQVPLNDSIFQNETLMPQINSSVTDDVYLAETQVFQQPALNKTGKTNLTTNLPQTSGAVFLEDTQLPTLGISAKHSHSSSLPSGANEIFMEDTQVPTIGKLPRHSNLPMEAENVFSQVPVFGRTEINKDSHFLHPASLRKKSLFITASKRHKSRNRVSSSNDSLVNSSQLNDSVFLMETQSPAEAVRAEGQLLPTEYDDIFLEATQIPTIVTNKLPDTSPCNRLFLDETEVPITNANKSPDTSHCNKIFLDETQVPITNANKLPDTSPCNRIFLVETQVPITNAHKSPDTSHCNRIFLDETQVPITNANKLPDSSPCNRIFLDETQVPITNANKLPDTSPCNRIFLDETQVPITDANKLPDSSPCNRIFLDETQVPITNANKSPDTSHCNRIFLDETQVPITNANKLPDSSPCNRIFLDETQVPITNANKLPDTSPCNRIFRDETQVPITDANKLPDSSHCNRLFLDETQVPITNANKLPDKSSCNRFFLDETQIPESIFLKSTKTSTPSTDPFLQETQILPSISSHNSKLTTSLTMEDLTPFFEQPFYSESENNSESSGSVREDATTGLACTENNADNVIESDSDIDEFILSSDIIDDYEDETEIYDHVESQSKLSKPADNFIEDGRNRSGPILPPGSPIPGSSVCMDVSTHTKPSFNFPCLSKRQYELGLEEKDSIQVQPSYVNSYDPAHFPIRSLSGNSADSDIPTQRGTVIDNDHDGDSTDSNVGENYADQPTQLRPTCVSFDVTLRRGGVTGNADDGDSTDSNVGEHDGDEPTQLRPTEVTTKVSAQVRSSPSNSFSFDSPLRRGGVTRNADDGNSTDSNVGEHDGDEPTQLRPTEVTNKVSAQVHSSSTNSVSSDVPQRKSTVKGNADDGDSTDSNVGEHDGDEPTQLRPTKVTTKGSVQVRSSSTNSANSVECHVPPLRSTIKGNADDGDSTDSNVGEHDGDELTQLRTTEEIQQKRVQVKRELTDHADSSNATEVSEEEEGSNRPKKCLEPNFLDDNDPAYLTTTQIDTNDNVDDSNSVDQDISSNNHRIAISETDDVTDVDSVDLSRLLDTSTFHRPTSGDTLDVTDVESVDVNTNDTVDVSDEESESLVQLTDGRQSSSPIQVLEEHLTTSVISDQRLLLAEPGGSGITRRKRSNVPHPVLDAVPSRPKRARRATWKVKENTPNSSSTPSRNTRRGSPVSSRSEAPDINDAVIYSASLTVPKLIIRRLPGQGTRSISPVTTRSSSLSLILTRSRAHERESSQSPVSSQSQSHSEAISDNEVASIPRNSRSILTRAKKRAQESSSSSMRRSRARRVRESVETSTNDESEANSETSSDQTNYNVSTSRSILTRAQPSSRRTRSSITIQPSNEASATTEEVQSSPRALRRSTRTRGVVNVGFARLREARGKKSAHVANIEPESSEGSVRPRRRATRNAVGVSEDDDSQHLSPPTRKKKIRVIWSDEDQSPGPPR